MRGDDLCDATTIPTAVERGEKAVKASQGSSGLADLTAGDTTGITDTIADLLHLANANGLDADEAVRRARVHFDAEGGQ